MPSFANNWSKVSYSNYNFSYYIEWCWKSSKFLQVLEVHHSRRRTVQLWSQHKSLFERRQVSNKSVWIDQSSDQMNGEDISMLLLMKPTLKWLDICSTFKSSYSSFMCVLFLLLSMFSIDSRWNSWNHFSLQWQHCSNVGNTHARRSACEKVSCAEILCHRMLAF
jgi:hypothetical protein